VLTIIGKRDRGKNEMKDPAPISVCDGSGQAKALRRTPYSGAVGWDAKHIPLGTEIGAG